MRTELKVPGECRKSAKLLSMNVDQQGDQDGKGEPDEHQGQANRHHNCIPHSAQEVLLSRTELEGLRAEMIERSQNQDQFHLLQQLMIQHAK